MQPYYLKKVPTIENVNNSIANSLVNINKSFQIPEVTQVPSGISLYSLPTVGKYTYTPYNYSNSFSYNRFTDPYGITSLSDAFLNRAGRERLTGRKENDFLDYIANTSQALGHYAKESYIDPLLDFDVLEFVVNGVGALGEDLDTFSNITKGMAVESGQDAGDVLANVATAVTVGLGALLATGAVTTLGAGIGAAAGLATLGGTVLTGVRALAQDVEGATLGVERALGLGDEGRYTYDLDSGNMFGNFLIEFSVDPLNFIQSGTSLLSDAARKAGVQKSARVALETLATTGKALDDNFTKLVLYTNPVSASFLGLVKVVGPSVKATINRCSSYIIEALQDSPFKMHNLELMQQKNRKELTQMLDNTVEEFPDMLKGLPTYRTVEGTKKVDEFSDVLYNLYKGYTNKFSDEDAWQYTLDDFVDTMVTTQTERVGKNAKYSAEAFKQYGEALLTISTLREITSRSIEASFDKVISDIVQKVGTSKDLDSLFKAMSDSLQVPITSEGDLINYLMQLEGVDGVAARRVAAKMQDFLHNYLDTPLSYFDSNYKHLTDVDKEKMENLSDDFVLGKAFKKVSDRLFQIAEEGIAKGDASTEEIDEFIGTFKLDTTLAKKILKGGEYENIPIRNLKEQASLELFNSKSNLKSYYPIRKAVTSALENMDEYLLNPEDLRKDPLFKNFSYKYAKFKEKLTYFRDAYNTVYEAVRKQGPKYAAQNPEWYQDPKVIYEVLKKKKLLNISDTYENLLAIQAELKDELAFIQRHFKDANPNLIKDLRELVLDKNFYPRTNMAKDIANPSGNPILDILKVQAIEEAKEQGKTLYGLQLNKTALTVFNMLSLYRFDSELSDFANTVDGTGVILKVFAELDKVPSSILGDFKDGPAFCKDILNMASSYVNFRNLVLLTDEGVGTKIPLNELVDILSHFNADMSAKELLNNEKLLDTFLQAFPEEFHTPLRQYLKAQADLDLKVLKLPDGDFISAAEAFKGNDFTHVLRQIYNTPEFQDYITPNSYEKIFGASFQNAKDKAKFQDAIHALKIHYKAMGKYNHLLEDMYIEVPKDEAKDFVFDFNRKNKDLGLYNLTKRNETAITNFDSTEGGMDLGKRFPKRDPKMEQLRRMREALSEMGIEIDYKLDRSQHTLTIIRHDTRFASVVLGPGMLVEDAMLTILNAESKDGLEGFIYNIIKNDGTIDKEMYDQVSKMTLKNGNAMAALANLVDIVGMADKTRYLTSDGFNEIAYNTGAVFQEMILEDVLTFLKYGVAGGTMAIDKSILASETIFSAEVQQALIDKGVKFVDLGDTVFINAQKLLTDDTIPTQYTRKYDMPSRLSEDQVAESLSRIMQFKEDYTGYATPFGVNSAVDVRFKSDVYLEYLGNRGVLFDVDQDVIIKSLQQDKLMKFSVIGTHGFLVDNVIPVSGNALEHLRHELVSTVHHANKSVMYTNVLLSPSTKMKHLFSRPGQGMVSAEEILDIYKAVNSEDSGNMIAVFLGKDLQLHEMPIRTVKDVERALAKDASVIPLMLYNDIYKHLDDYELPKFLQWFVDNIQGPYNAGYLTSTGTVARNLVDATVKNIVNTGDPRVIDYMLETPKALKRVNEILMDIGNTTESLEAIEKIELLPYKDKKLLRMYSLYSDARLASNPTEAIMKLARDSAGKLVMPEDEIKSLGQLVWRNKLTETAVKGFETVEDMGRFGLFWYYMSEASGEYTVSEIATKVIKTHFDYGKKTPIQRWAQLFYPFHKFPLENFLWWGEKAPRASLAMKTTLSTVTDEWVVRQPDPYSSYASSQLMSGNMTVGDTLVKWNPSVMDALTYAPKWLMDPTDGMSAPIKNIAKVITHGLQTLTGQEPEAPDYEYPWEVNLTRAAKVITQTIPKMVEGDIGEAPNLVPSLFSKSSSKWKTEADAYGRSGWTPRASTMGYTIDRAKPVYSTNAYASYTGYAANAYSSGGTKYANRYPQKYYHRNAKFRYLPEMYNQYYTSGGYSRMLMRAKNGPMSPETLSYRLNDLKYQFKK